MASNNTNLCFLPNGEYDFELGQTDCSYSWCGYCDPARKKCWCCKEPVNMNELLVDSGLCFHKKCYEKEYPMQHLNNTQQP